MGYSPWGHKESDTTEQLHFFKTVTKGKAGLGVFEPLDTTSSPTNQYVTLFSVCFCLKTPYLMNC